MSNVQCKCTCVKADVCVRVCRVWVWGSCQGDVCGYEILAAWETGHSGGGQHRDGQNDPQPSHRWHCQHVLTYPNKSDTNIKNKSIAVILLDELLHSHHWSSNIELSVHSITTSTLSDAFLCRLPRCNDNGAVCVLRYPREACCELGPWAHENHSKGWGVLQEDHTTHGRSDSVSVWALGLSDDRGR